MALPGRLRAQRTPNAKEASDLEKTSLPENPRPEGLFQERGGRGLSRGPELCRSLRGTWKPRLWWTRRETSRGRDPRADHLSPRALRVGSGQQAPREGRQAGSGRTPPPSHTPSGPCPFNSAGQGPPPEPGTRSPCDLGWAWASPRTPWRKHSAGRRRPARPWCREGYLEMVPGGRSRSLRRGRLGVARGRQEGRGGGAEGQGRGGLLVQARGGGGVSALSEVYTHRLGITKPGPAGGCLPPSARDVSPLRPPGREPRGSHPGCGAVNWWGPEAQ